MRITATIHMIRSRHDVNGNSYTAFTFVDHRTGKRVWGLGDNPDSVDYAWNRDKPHRRGSIQTIESVLPIRQWERRTKNWPYAGCTGEELTKWIRRELRKAPA